MHPRVQQLIKQLELKVHPEGGYFREVYRSGLKIHSKGELTSQQLNLLFVNKGVLVRPIADRKGDLFC